MNFSPAALALIADRPIPAEAIASGARTAASITAQRAPKLANVVVGPWACADDRDANGRAA